jgi:hypothetical protein
MRVLRLAVLAVAAALLLGAEAATAKTFEPGDLRLCNRERCLPIMNVRALQALSAFYYTGRQPPAGAPAARIGAPALELQFTNGYVTGIVATARYDRYLSYGVNLERFARGRWYRVPDAAARELRRLGARLDPLHVTPAALASSR